MSKDRLRRDIIRAATELSTSKQPANQWIVPLGEREPDKRNHFVLFMKPELLAVRDGAKLGPILDVIGAGTFADAHVAVSARHGVGGA